MLIVMKSEATDSQIESVLRVIEELGFKGHPMPGATRTAIGLSSRRLNMAVPSRCWAKRVAAASHWFLLL